MAAVPIRQCRICRQRIPKSELSRYSLQEGKPVEDIKQRIAGRGIYICSPKCLEAFQKQLERKTRIKP